MRIVAAVVGVVFIHWVFLKYLTAPLWEAVAPAVLRVQLFFIGLSHPQLTLRWFDDKTTVFVSNSVFSMFSGKACSGFDGMLLFSLFFVLLLLRRPRGQKPWIAKYALGIVGVFLLNTFRVAGLFSLGTYLNRHYGAEQARRLFELAHFHSGYLVALVVLGGLWFFDSTESVQGRRPPRRLSPADVSVG